MGPFVPDRPPLDLRVESVERLETVIRKRISYLVEPGERVTSWLVEPSAPGRYPAVVCLHQTTAVGGQEPAGVAGDPTEGYALELAERGFVTISPDYPGFGESINEDPYAMGYASTTMKGIHNHMAAVDVLASLPRVDSHRIGALGQSLGGHNALFLAAFDPRVHAVVSSCGFSPFAAYHGGDLTIWGSWYYMPRIISVYGSSASQMPFDFFEVLESIAPRNVFVIAPELDDTFPVDSVMQAVADARPAFDSLDADANLSAYYPPRIPHAFTAATREIAYQWLSDRLTEESEPEEPQKSCEHQPASADD